MLPGHRRSAHSVVPLFTILFLFTAARPTPAFARGRHYTEEEINRMGFAVEPFHFSLGAITPSIGNLTFEGDGQLAGETTHYRATHLPQTTMFIGEVRPTVRFLHHFLAGFQMSTLWASYDANGAAAATRLGAGSSLSGMGGGVHLGAVYTRGFFDLRAEIDGGARQFYTTMSNFDVRTCSSKGRTYDCQPVASATQFYLQPRAYVGLHLGNMVTVGGFAGLDISPGIGWSAGGFFAVHSPWSAEVAHWDDMSQEYH